MQTDELGHFRLVWFRWAQWIETKKSMLIHNGKGNHKNYKPKPIQSIKRILQLLKIRNSFGYLFRGMQFKTIVTEF